MRHQKHRFSLGRKKEHRQALMANLAAALLRHDRIQTTLPKAKALRPFVEKIITMAKEAHSATPERKLHLRRLAVARVRDRDAIATLFNEKASMFSDRPGGYTRIYKLGTRVGDAAEMALIALIPADDEGHASRGKARASGAAKAAAPVAAVSAEAADAAEVVAESTPEAVAEGDVASEEAVASVVQEVVAESVPEEKPADEETKKPEAGA